MADSLSPEEWAQIKKITKQITDGIPDGEQWAGLIRGILAQSIVDANREWEALLRDEETHRWEFGHHSIAECRIDWCGRYRGQRR